MNDTGVYSTIDNRDVTLEQIIALVNFRDLAITEQCEAVRRISEHG